jgi:hypothetical protein
LALGALLGLPFASTRSAKLRDSGQMPESISPMTMFSPALPTPPSWSHRPPSADRPRNAGVDEVSVSRISSGLTERTSLSLASLFAWPAVRWAAKPLKLNE